MGTEDGLSSLRHVLRGDVVCATKLESTEAHAHVQEQVVILGGTFVNEISSNLTHLICSKAGGGKHRQVCERNQRASLADRVLIVKPKWLDACVNACLRVSAETFLLPPLTGLEICCSGLQADEKEHIEKLVNDMSGKYNKVLGMKCTHLICNTPSGKKYEHASTAMPNIHIVRPKWIEECARFNSLINESPFKLIQNNASLSKGPNNSFINPTVISTPLLPKPLPVALPSVHHHDQNDSELPNDNTTSAFTPLDALRVYLTESPIHDSQKHAPLRSKALQLIAHAGATALPDAISSSVNFIIALRVPVSSSTKPAIRLALESGIPIVPLRWLEDCVKHGHILPTTSYPTPDWETGKTLRQQQNENNRLNSYNSNNDSDLSNSQIAPNSETFKGIRISLGGLWLRDESICSKIEKQLLRGRANVLTHDSSGVPIMGVATHIVCASDIQSRENELLKKATSENKHVVAVTPFWVDSCEALEKLQSVNECVLFSPLKHCVPFKGMVAKRICITLSGFQQRNENNWNKRREVLSRLAELMGAKYSEKMRRKGTTHVVADTRVARSHKVRKAKEWGIQVVTHEWLLQCAQTGQVETPDGYEWSEPCTQGLDAMDTQRGDEVTPQRSSAPPRRSSRSGGRSSGDDQKAFSLFQRLNEGLGKTDKKKEHDGDDEIGDENDDQDNDEMDVVNADIFRSGRRSRSNSRDAIVNENSWSMDASQSQVIVHRDLTPPPTPRSKSIYGRGVATRSSKRSRTTE